MSAIDVAVDEGALETLRPDVALADLARLAERPRPDFGAADLTLSLAISSLWLVTKLES